MKAIRFVGVHHFPTIADVPATSRVRLEPRIRTPSLPCRSVLRTNPMPTTTRRVGIDV